MCSFWGRAVFDPATMRAKIIRHQQTTPLSSGKSGKPVSEQSIRNQRMQTRTHTHSRRPTHRNRSHHVPLVSGLTVLLTAC